MPDDPSVDDSSVDDPSVLVFAYGSNLLTQRMQARVSTAVPVVVGYVRQRRLTFHKRSDDGSAKADAALTGDCGDQVWGVVYRMHGRQKSMLDGYESLGIGYNEEIVDVVHQTGSIKAWMYVARPSAIDSTLMPYSWYHNLVVEGAVQHQLPADYIRLLRTIQTIADPDAQRHSTHARLIDR